MLLYLLLFGLAGMLVAAGGFVYLYQTTELPDPNADFETQTSFVYYADGKSPSSGSTRPRTATRSPYDQMPQDVKDAVVAAENRTFWSDNGIDLKGIVRAVFNNASGNATQGASTITQQYVKILYLTQERSYKRKLKEAILSLKLGRDTSKQEILEGYLNTIYFGRGAYGIQAAAQAYFDKDAKDLNLKESAALASIINNPTQLRPGQRRGLEAGAAGALRLRARRHGQDGRHHRRRGRAGRAEAAEVPEEQADDKYGGQKGHMLTMVKNELTTLTNQETGEPFTDDRDRRRWPADHHDVHPEGDGRRRAGREGGPAGGQGVQRQGAAHRRRQRPARHRCGARLLRRPGLPRSQINWAVAGGQAGSSFKPFALAAGLKEGFSLKDTFDGNSPFVLETATRSATRATTTTARRSTCSRPPRTRSTRPSPTSRSRCPTDRRRSSR